MVVFQHIPATLVVLALIYLPGIDVATKDIADILSCLSARPYISQEVIWGDGEAVHPSEYVDNGTFYFIFFFHGVC